MSSSFLKLLAALFTIGCICGATGLSAQAASRSDATLSSLSEEASLAALGQLKLPWWAKDMRLPGAPSNAQRDLHAILAENREERALKSLLGDHQWRSLDGARFAMEVDSLGFTHAPEQDRTRQDEIEREMSRNLVRLARENLQERLGLEERAERYLNKIVPKAWAEKVEASSDDRDRSRSLGLRFSPRLSVGHGTRVGLKMRANGLSSPLIRGASLRVGYDFRYDDTRLVLAFEHPYRDRDLYLEYQSNDEFQGQYFRLSLRFSY